MASEVGFDENNMNTRRLSQKISPTARSIEYITPPKRATTVHITSPASRTRRTGRPLSHTDVPQDDTNEGVQTLAPPSYQRKPRLPSQIAPGNKIMDNRSADVEVLSVIRKPTMITESGVVDRGDPFVTYNSDSSFSVESSLADDHSIRSLPTVRPGSSGVPLAPSAAALQNPAAAAAALAAANARSRSPKGYRHTASFSTPKRTRPASVAVMTSTSTTITEDASSRPRTPERLEAMNQTPISSARRPRHVSSPVMISTEDVSATPPSLVRRLSRRLSVTSRDFLVSNTGTPNRSEVAIPSFPSIQDLPPIPAPAFPNPDQLASLHRRNSAHETLTPPRLRGRSNTAPKAATGARRYAQFPDLMEGEINNVLEEEDVAVEEVPVVVNEVLTIVDQELPTSTPVVEPGIAQRATETPEETAVQTTAEAEVETTPVSTSVKRKEKLQARLNGARALLIPGSWSGEKREKAEMGEGEGTKCTVM